MRSPLALFLATLCFASSLAAKDIVIFAKDKVVEIDTASSASPGDFAMTVFLNEFRRIAAPGTPLEGGLELGNPPAWGKTISAVTRGELEFERTATGGFIGRLRLDNLLPNHRYILTLNGNPKLAGNELLPDPVPGLPEERFYDFLTVETDGNGRYAATLGVFLKPGPYAVRIYIKDTADFKLVLYHDYFPFTVK